MSQEVSLSAYGWGGMLSIWGQGDKAYQGVCYSGLAYHPEDYIDIIQKDGPPVEKWLVRYVDLPLANDWLAYCINHILPEEVLKHIVFTRVHSKVDWPAKYATEIDKDEIIDEYNFDGEDDGEERTRLQALQKKKYGGCLPWLKISFSQELPANVIFAVGVLLRYASEHGPVLKMLELIPQLEPSIKPEHRMTVAMNVGGARGHALGSWGWGYLKQFREQVEKFDWRARFLKMQKACKPFHVDPNKRGSVDDWFQPKWGNNSIGSPEVYCSSYGSSILKRNGLVVRTRHNLSNEVFSLWDAKGK